MDLVFLPSFDRDPGVVCHYGAYVSQKRVGMGILRISPRKSKDLPAGWESHVYYEITEGFRGRGYGKALLYGLLRKAWSLGLTEVRLTCAKDNHVSRHIIESAGAVEIARLPETAERPTFLLYEKVRP